MIFGVISTGFDFTLTLPAKERRIKDYARCDILITKEESDSRMNLKRRLVLFLDTCAVTHKCSRAQRESDGFFRFFFFYSQ